MIKDPEITDDIDPKLQPLGILLRTARENKGWTRKNAEYMTGIKASSLVRYESWGILNEHGLPIEEAQRPPVDKLARLCLELDIPPSIALATCLDNTHKKFEAVVAFRKERPLMWEYIEDQFSALLRDQYIWRDLFRHLFGPKPAPKSKKYARTLELIGIAKNLFKAQEKFEQFILKTGKITKFAYYMSVPNSKAKMERDELDYAGNVNIEDSYSAEEIAEMIGWEKPTRPGSKEWHGNYGKEYQPDWADTVEFSKIDDFKDK